MTQSEVEFCQLTGKKCEDVRCKKKCYGRLLIEQYRAKLKERNFNPDKLIEDMQGLSQEQINMVVGTLFPYQPEAKWADEILEKILKNKDNQTDN